MSTFTKLANSTHTINRFYLDGQGYVIDSLSPNGTGIEKWEEPKWVQITENGLRDAVLMHRLRAHAKVLFKPSSLAENEEFESKEAKSIANIYPFNGTLKTEKREIHECTSLTLFVDDVERVVRDLFGEFDGEGIKRVMRAVFNVTWEFLRHICPELMMEEYYAKQYYDLDEAELNDGAESYLAIRALYVRTSPSQYSKYTIEFIRHLDEGFSLPSLGKINSLKLVTKAA
jgi:hypothetical protein